MNVMTEVKNLAAARAGAPTVRLTAAQALIETLTAHQVKDVFGVIGSRVPEAPDLFHAAGIRLVSAARAQSAAHMADGYGRVTGRPAVCIAQEGGIVHLAAAVAAAHSARTPLVVITPELAIPTDRGALPEMARLPVLSGITRWQAHVSAPLQIPELLHRAFAVATHERGPVHVSLDGGSFHDEGEYQILPPLAIERVAGGADSLGSAASMLAAARLPVILAGEAVGADGSEAIRTLAEYLTAPVVNPYRHNDTFPAAHPLACGPLGPHGSKAAMRIFSRADVVLSLGARFESFGALRRKSGDCWPEDARLIQVDSDGSALGVGLGDTLAIQGDARLAARELLRQLKARAPRKPDRARLAEVQREKTSWLAELAAWPSPARKGQIAARRALAQLARALPRNAMVATDAGSVCAMAASYLGFEGPPSYFAAMSQNTRGCAYPMVMGAKMARPDRPAIACVGDGAWTMALAEIMTAVKEKIPAVATVFNNGLWDAGRQGVARDARPTSPDFSEVARVMGAEGYRVEHEDEVADALKAALRSGKPAVVEIMLAREPVASRNRRQPSR